MAAWKGKGASYGNVLKEALESGHAEGELTVCSFYLCPRLPLSLSLSLVCVYVPVDASACVVVYMCVLWLNVNHVNV